MIKMDDNASAVSTEALIMSLLEQIQCLESERDNARVLASRMRERLEYVQTNNNTLNTDSDGSSVDKQHDDGSNNNISLVKMVKEVSSGMIAQIEQIITNEEHRYLNLKELSSETETDQAASLRGQLSVCKEHYEKLLEDAENDKVALRKKLREQQDMLLDKDIKIKELERKLESMSSSDTVK